MCHLSAGLPAYCHHPTLVVHTPQQAVRSPSSQRCTPMARVTRVSTQQATQLTPSTVVQMADWTIIATVPQLATTSGPATNSNNGPGHASRASVGHPVILKFDNMQQWQPRRPSHSCCLVQAVRVTSTLTVLQSVPATGQVAVTMVATLAARWAACFFRQPRLHHFLLLPCLLPMTCALNCGGLLRREPQTGSSHGGPGNGCHRAVSGRK